MKIQQPLLLLLFFIAIAFFLPLGITPLFDLDEGAFSEATREMLVGKDYITTYLNGELRFDKPIFIYWLQLLSIKTLGITEFALRLPSAIAGALWALTIYLFVTDVADKQKAFFAALFMVGSLQINLIAKAAIADALLNLFIILTMFSIYYYFKHRTNNYIYWTFFFMALGVLTKGPVAILIPLVTSFIFFSLKKEFILWLKTVFNPIGILIFVLIALPWYIAEYMTHGQAFIEGFFLKHNISRFNSAMESHRGNYFYYVPVVLLGFMPFTALMLKSLASIKSFLYDDLKLYLLIWFMFVFLFFSFSETKLPHYIIYGYTPLFILGALTLNDEVNKKWLIYPMLFLLMLLLFLADIATFFKTDIRDNLAVVLIENAYETFNLEYRLSLLLIIIVLLLLLFKKVKQELLLPAIALIMILMLNFVVIPAYGNLMQQPIKEAALLAKKEGYHPIVMYGVNTPSFNVYYENLVEKRKPSSGDIIFTKVPKLKEFQSYETLYKKNGFTLIHLQSILPLY